MGMGMSVSAQIWQQFIDLDFQDDLIKCKQNFDVIMDDTFIHLTAEEHMDDLIDLFKVLRKYGLKLSPHKCQFFKKKIVYMGLDFQIQEDKVCYTPLKDKCDAIRNLESPKTLRQTRAFCGMVNFLSSFLPNLHRLLILIYDLEKKAKKFKWTEEAEKAFNDIKRLLINPPVLKAPTPDGLFQLESDTSREGVGGTLLQKQGDEWVVIGYHSKRLPKSAKNFGVTELELTGLLVNIHGFMQLLCNRYFEVLVDHKAIKYMIKSKTESPMMRLKTLLLKLSEYTIDLKYQKGSEMHTSDALSRLHNFTDTPDQKDVIPLNFLQHFTPYYIEHSYSHLVEDLYAHKTKTLDATTVKQKHGRPTKPKPQIPSSKPRTPTAAKNLTAQPRQYPRSLNNEIVCRQMIDEINAEWEKSDRLTVAKLNAIKQFNKQDHKSKLMTEKYSLLPLNPQQLTPVQTAIQRMSEKHPDYEIEPVNTIRPPGIAYTQTPQALVPIDTPLSIIRKHIPRQSDIDKIVKNIETRIVHSLELLIQAQDLVKAYQHSTHFCDIYQYITDGKVPSSAKAQNCIRAKALNYVTINHFLFRIDMQKDKDIDKGSSFLLVIPEKYEPIIFNTYHDSLLAGHQGPYRTAMTIRQKFFIHNLMNKVKRYIEACHTCLKTKPKYMKNRPTYGRIPVDYAPMQDLSIDIKMMPQAFRGYHLLLVITCDQTNFMIAVPLRDRTAQMVAEALIYRVIYLFGPPRQIISNEAMEFLSAIIQAILCMLNSKLKVISPYNRSSSKCERQIQTISEIIMKYLWDKDQMWPLFTTTAAYTMNTFASEALSGLSPFQLIFLRDPPDQTSLSFPKIDTIPVKHREYYNLLLARAQLVGNMLLEWRTKQALEYESKVKKF